MENFLVVLFGAIAVVGFMIFRHLRTVEKSEEDPSSDNSLLRYPPFPW